MGNEGRSGGPQGPKSTRSSEEPIEGACRHLVKDRMDLTGARWGLSDAEAILRLRALRSNSDFEDYWRYHLAQERHRVHQSRYAGHVIPHAA